jgi:hypothetical protein
MPGYENETLPALPGHGGVYLQAFAYVAGGFITHAAGLTGRPFRQRFKEHKRSIERGDYNIFDADKLTAGIKAILWQGWKVGRANRAAFAARQIELEAAARRECAAHRIFVARIEDPRIRERLEAAIMNRLSAAPAPFGNLIDKGMSLRPRRRDEQPISVWSACPSQLHGLLGELTI